MTRPGGYLLRAGPEQLDVARFERLLADGRAAARRRATPRPRPRGCGRRWRCGAVRRSADLALLEFAQPEIRRLEELRLLALMERIDADLALGADAELIAELEGLVASNPLQERLRAQLMLALYRAGRQAEALAVYRQTSEMLRDELGLEPSRALQELERLILAQDASLDWCQLLHAPRDATWKLAVCPFKGLASFDRSDAEYFSGRERIVISIWSRARRSRRWSGSSARRASESPRCCAPGCLSALRGGRAAGERGWRQVLCGLASIPARSSRERSAASELAAACRGLAPGRADRGRGRSARRAVHASAQTTASSVAFLDRLAEAARDTERRALVLVSLRADFYGRWSPTRALPTCSAAATCWSGR